MQVPTKFQTASNHLLRRKSILYPSWHIGLLAWCCPCIVIGNNAEAIGEDKNLCLLGSLASLLVFPLGYLVIRFILRNKIREAKGIKVGMCVEDYIYIYDCLHSICFLLLMLNREIIALTVSVFISVACALWYKRQGWVVPCQFHTDSDSLNHHEF